MNESRTTTAGVAGEGRPDEDLEAYLAPTWYLDGDHPAVADFARRAVAGAESDVDKAVRLFYAVRDGIRYDPYSIRISPEWYRASHCLAQGRGFCVYKSGLMTAACRAVGVPARIGFADVRNHLCTERLRRLMGGDVFYYHGYAELRLAGRWVKATPIFNIELCEKFGVRPLEFDGRSDSLLQPFDAENRRHMEYIRDHGTFADMPYERLEAVFSKHYPKIAALAAGSEAGDGLAGDFAAEAEAESAGKSPSEVARRPTNRPGGVA